MTLALVAAGCGSSGNGEQDKSASQVWADARAATTSVSDLRVTGTITNEGQTVSLDLVMSRSGNGGGTIGVNGQDVDLVVHSGLVYMRADKKAWEEVSGGDTMDKYAGHWVMSPLSGSSISNFADFASSTKFLANLKPKGALTKHPGTVVWDGHRTVVIADSTRAEIYISGTGKPYVLHLSGGDSSSSGTMTFSDFGQAPPPPAPKGAKSFL